MSEERTERATPRKRQKASEKGDRVRSRELVAATGMMAGVLALGWIVESWGQRWRAGYEDFLALGTPLAWRTDQVDRIVVSIRHATITMLSPFLLLFAAVTGTALLVSVAQGAGIRFNVEALQPKWNHFNPASNLKNLFSLRGAGRLGKSLVPTIPLLILACRKIEQQAGIAQLSIGRLEAIWESLYVILLDASWVLVLWSAVDYLIEWRSWESRQKMTKQEMRDEYRQTEGNPRTRGRIRGLRRQMRKKQLQGPMSRAPRWW